MGKSDSHHPGRMTVQAVEEKPDGRRLFRTIITADVVDRQGEVLDPAGFTLREYRDVLNCPIMDTHSNVTVGRFLPDTLQFTTISDPATGKKVSAIEGVGEIFSAANFPPKDGGEPYEEYPIWGEVWKHLVSKFEEGRPSGVSIGGDPDPNLGKQVRCDAESGKCHIFIPRVYLYEVSVVRDGKGPANPLAINTDINRSAKSGADTNNFPGQMSRIHSRIVKSQGPGPVLLFDLHLLGEHSASREHLTKSCSCHTPSPYAERLIRKGLVPKPQPKTFIPASGVRATPETKRPPTRPAISGPPKLPPPQNPAPISKIFHQGGEAGTQTSGASTGSGTGNPMQDWKRQPEEDGGPVPLHGDGPLDGRADEDARLGLGGPRSDDQEAGAIPMPNANEATRTVQTNSEGGHVTPWTTGGANQDYHRDQQATQAEGFVPVTVYQRSLRPVVKDANGGSFAASSAASGVQTSGDSGTTFYRTGGRTYEKRKKVKKDMAQAIVASALAKTGFAVRPPFGRTESEGMRDWNLPPVPSENALQFREAIQEWMDGHGGPPYAYGIVGQALEDEKGREMQDGRQGLNEPPSPFTLYLIRLMDAIDAMNAPPPQPMMPQEGGDEGGGEDGGGEDGPPPKEEKAMSSLAKGRRQALHSAQAAMRRGDRSAANDFLDEADEAAPSVPARGIKDPTVGLVKYRAHAHAAQAAERAGDVEGAKRHMAAYEAGRMANPTHRSMPRGISAPATSAFVNRPEGQQPSASNLPKKPDAPAPTRGGGRVPQPVTGSPSSPTGAKPQTPQQQIHQQQAQGGGSGAAGQATVQQERPEPKGEAGRERGWGASNPQGPKHLRGVASEGAGEGLPKPVPQAEGGGEDGGGGEAEQRSTFERVAQDFANWQNMADERGRPLNAKASMADFQDALRTTAGNPQRLQNLAFAQRNIRRALDPLAQGLDLKGRLEAARNAHRSGKLGGSARDRVVLDVLSQMKNPDGSPMGIDDIAAPEWELAGESEFEYRAREEAQAQRNRAVGQQMMERAGLPSISYRGEHHAPPVTPYAQRLAGKQGLQAIQDNDIRKRLKLLVQADLDFDPETSLPPEFDSLSYEDKRKFLDGLMAEARRAGRVGRAGSGEG